jgi:biopolymer transport protein ExbD
MLTRPLDLASKLRREPRSFDWLFLMNGGLIVLFFFLFGSRFVLAPGLGVGFELPQAPGVNADARPTTHVITVVNAGQIFAGDGLRSIDQLQGWLEAQARTEKRPSLLVRASSGVPAAILTQILGMAHAAGFSVTLAAEEQNDAPRGAAASR